ncbi:M14 family zinc carboxypeptidase [Plantactinospora sp. GCM10030261]|uniref:M14 family zinc carboxypeptidase n=1 Tax=Plantactinospora sp. GCM10030261 TaxID=3273420 RepID=UPI0036115208
MSRIRTLAAATTSAVLAGALLTAPAQAAPGVAAPDSAAPPAPNPAALTATGPTGRLGGDISNEQLARELDRVARASAGKVRISSIGTTNEGRPIKRATLGHGPTKILYVTQQHGNEPLGTPAALRALWGLGVPNTAWHRWLRDRITLDIVVRANPDGHARDWRYNYDPDADPEYGQAGQGYDINRYHDPAVAPADNPVPEAAAIQRLWLQTRPDIVVDYHMQGRYISPDGRQITASILWPTNPTVSERAVDRGRQLAVLNHEALTRTLGANVSQYPGGDYEGIARNAYGIRGSASLLVELSDLGPAYEEFQIRSALVSMLVIAQSAADGSLWRIDPDRADAIPPRGEPADRSPAEAREAA